MNETIKKEEMVNNSYQPHNEKSIEIIGLGTLFEEDRTTYSILVEYLENGIEYSTNLYISKWRWDRVETNIEVRDLLHNELMKQLELKN
jgi:hypothetical protein